MRHLSNALPTIVFSAILAGISAGTTALAYPGGTGTAGLMDQNSTDTASSMYRDSWMMGNHTGKMGMITGITNDAEGNPAWLLAGHWKLDSDSNGTATGDTGSGNVSDFSATIHMVMLNGSAPHSHEISNFTQTEESTFNTTANSTTYVGTSTITMREGPVSDVGTRITMSDSVLKVELDPTMIDDHFGGSPIYGIEASYEMMGKHNGMMSDTMTQDTGNMTGMMNDMWHDNGTGTSSTMDEIWK
jgi:hypothetical protein